MELSHLRYIIKLAEIANYSKAAEQLFITQPALSQQVRALEEEIGVKLFERTTRKVSLTDAGQEFVRKAQIVLNDAEELTRAMEQHRRKTRSILSVGLLGTLSHLNIPEYINSFRRQYPDIQIELQIGWSAELITRVKMRELDVAITNVYFKEDEAPDPSLNIIPFLEDTIVVVASRYSSISGKAFVTIDDLCDLPVVGLDSKTSIRMQMNDILLKASSPPAIICTCPDMDSLIGMVETNVGITFLSSGVAQSYLQQGLVSIPLRPVWHTQTAMVTYHKQAPTHALRIFEDYFNGVIH